MDRSFLFIGSPGFTVPVSYKFGKLIAAVEIIFNKFGGQFLHLIGEAVIPQIIFFAFDGLQERQTDIHVGAVRVPEMIIGCIGFNASYNGIVSYIFQWTCRNVLITS